MAAQPDFYEVLQVHPAAEPEVIQAAYRRLSLKYHPDVYHGPDAQQRMASLNQAYAVIGDPQKRSAYDRQRFGGRATSAVTTGPSLQVTPQELDLGSLALGRSRTATIRVRNIGPGQLSGMIISHVSWLQVTPTDFVGNDQDVVLRFQPNTTGEFRSPRALEVYSNGGRVSIDVRGRVQEAREGGAEPREAPSSPRTENIANRPPAYLAKAPWRKVRVPFMAWVALGTALSSIVWFNIAPALVSVPVALGVWLAWEHFVGRTTVTVPKSPAKRETRRGAPKLARCLACNASINPSNVRKCSRCGGSICARCGACPCRGFGARA